MRVELSEAATLSQVLERDERWLSEAAPVAAISVVGRTELSLGVAQPLDAPVAQRSRQLGIPVTRRSSGGTAVLHRHGDLVFSVVLPRDHSAVGRGFTRAYGRLGAGIVRMFARRGVELVWSPADGHHPELCLLGSRGEVLRHGRRILGGAAQHLARGALLHHGVVQRAVDPALLADLFALDRREARRRLMGFDELKVDLDGEANLRELATDLASSLPAE